MADEKKAPEKGAEPREVERLVVVESEETRRSRAYADAAKEARGLGMDEVGQGHPGHYEVNGRLVDGNGNPVKKDRD